MAVLECGDTRVELGPGESVLEGLLRAGLTVPHGCRAGACQACLVRATRGNPPVASQAGLKDTLRAEGYFLACSALPEEDLAVTLSAAPTLNVPARVEAIEPLAADVVRVRLLPYQSLSYRPGQFINVVRSDGLTRSYSLASLPGEDRDLELHVRVLPGGRMSGWLADPANVGAEVELRGPAGQCFYAGGDRDQPLLLAGAGTGLAPLWGILRDALVAGHRGRIALFHGARSPDGLYLGEELRSLCMRFAQVTVVRCALEGDEHRGVTQGRLDDVVFGQLPTLGGYRVFLCGDPALVSAMRRRAFLAGASLRDIHADAFVTAPHP